MKGTPNPGCRAILAAVAAALALLLAAMPTRADDIQTLSGQTFHAVRAVRVEPDGVTWEHAGGVVKVDFSDSPANVREAYHYDPAKAAAYHDAQAEARRQADERTHQTLQANTERQRAHAQAAVQAAAVPGTAATTASTDLSAGAPPTLVYPHGLSDTARTAARAIGEQTDAREAQAALDARNAGGLGNPNLWKYVPGVGSKPAPLRMDQPNAAEYKADLHHAPGDDFSASSATDTFFNPLYLTRSYNDDMDRAAAFARGTPLK